MIAILQLPSLKKATKRAFEVVRGQTDAAQPAIYPITEFVGAVFDAKERKPNLAFPRLLRKLYEKNEKRFVAAWFDEFDRKVHVFVRRGEEFEYFGFNEEDALGGLVTIFVNFWEKGDSVYLVADEVLSEIAKEAIRLANEARERHDKAPIPLEAVKEVEVRVDDEDERLLIRYHSPIDKFLRKLAEKARIERLKESLFATWKGEEESRSEIFPVLFAALLAAAAAAYCYYSKSCFAGDSKSKVDENRAMRAKMERKLAERNSAAFASVVKVSEIARKLPEKSFLVFEAKGDEAFLMGDAKAAKGLLPKKRIAYYEGVSAVSAKMKIDRFVTKKESARYFKGSLPPFDAAKKAGCEVLSLVSDAKTQKGSFLCAPESVVEFAEKAGAGAKKFRYDVSVIVKPDGVYVSVERKEPKKKRPVAAFGRDLDTRIKPRSADGTSGYIGKK